MGGWHHWLSGHEFEQALGESGGQRSLTHCSPWGCKEWDMTEQLNECQWNMNTGEGYPCQPVPMKGVCTLFFSFPLFSVLKCRQVWGIWTKWVKPVALV